MIEFFSLFINWILERPVGGMILIMVCFILGIAVMIPRTLFMIAIGIVCHLQMGVILGYFISLLIVYLCIFIGSILAFLISRTLLKECLISLVKPNMIKTRAILKALEIKGFKIVLLLRLANIIPFAVLNYALGASNVNIKDYMLGSIGLIPKLALFMYVTFSVESLTNAISEQKSNTTQIIIIVSIGCAFAIIAGIYIAIVAKREMSKLLDESSEPILSERNEGN